MSAEILVNLAVEDELSEHVLRNMLRQSRRSYLVGLVYGKRGVGYLQKNLTALNNAAAGSAHLMLADLDRIPCAPSLIESWFGCEISEYRSRCHRNLLFNVAVREVESWVMADIPAFSQFFGISQNSVPAQTDAIPDPKEFLINLARKSRYRSVREDIAPRLGDKRIIGPNYNGKLAEFLHESWRLSRARAHSASLARTADILDRFQPMFSSN